jgi:protein TonB
MAVADLRVVNPELISKVEPVYPELARVARLEGTVILQASIGKDGAVHDVEVRRDNRPGMGFDEAASVADQPVEVYFTVFVDFWLR